MNPKLRPTPLRKRQDFLKEVWRPVCRALKSKVLSKRRSVRFQRDLGCTCGLEHEGLELSAFLADSGLDNVGYSI